MKLACCWSATLLLILVPSCCQSGNILVIPTEGSHWLNNEILLKALHSRGHNITIARSSKSWYVKDSSPYYSTFTVPVERSFDKKYTRRLVTEYIKFQRGASPLVSFLHVTMGMIDKNVEVHRAVSEFLPAMLDDTELMRRLNQSKFDLVLTDPWWGNGAIVAKYLNLPLVYNVRWLNPEEAHFAVAPSPISYIPVTLSGYTDKMNFFQRTKNMIIYLITQIQTTSVSKLVYQPLCSKYLGPDADFDQIKSGADIWLIRTDFVFDYPRPTMPNVVYMGGFHCTPAKPLPKDLEDFVQSSGEHGVIIMSLGTFVPSLPDDMANKIAASFAELPQKVIWSYSGSKPSTLGNNTLLVDWMPQKDLLGHPKVKLFVAHGGTNGVQEAIYHGVPVVGLSLFFFFVLVYDNLLRLQDRGGAKVLTLTTVDKDDNFLKAVKEVLNEPSYRANMQRLSRLHRDQPIQPIDNALFWIEFVMRNKGAAHLKAQSHGMSWYIYHSVDVALFLTGAVLLMLLTAVTFIRCLCKSPCRGKLKRD
ncbi:LOW QUALITY PROTEIN: UDP-glucuronosyltransferase 2C1-like [Poecilia formosa]|uniref:LOW QUALITY PROTEIN: UDP-glucuronosyltransferase 2C1-like n=1 Tax=Poecilia formosa TaxID=48698 RepID=UPI0004444EBE|nr:PREDICTED: LOW QUALITY PROTEIN: UDP-glucuronosyltransferase 2C1-like [Poecilia formosa]